MPDTITPPQQPAMPEGASPEQVFAHFQSIDPGNQQQPAPEQSKAEPAAMGTSAPLGKVPEKPAEQPKADDIPEQFLTGKKAEQQPQEDEFEKLMSTEPQGQLKHDDWKRYKSAVSKKVDALTAQLREREEKLAAAEKRGVPEEISKKLEQYEKTLAEREAVLERIAVQESPKFKSQFTVKEVSIGERLKRSGAELGLDTDALDMALKSSPKRRAEILDQMEMGETARSSLAGLMNQFDLLQDEKTEFLNQSKEVHAKWQQEQQQAAAAKEQQRVEWEKQTTEKVLSEMSRTYAPLQHVEGNAAWNAQADSIRSMVTEIVNGERSFEELVQVAAKGAGAPVTERILERVMKERDQLAEEVASLKKAQPGSSGHVPHSNGAPDDSHLSVEQRRMQTFNRFVGQ